MSEFDCVPITEVTNLNINSLWDTILEDISECSFLALDVEMSGLGCLASTMKSDMNDRYVSLCEAAATRSVISLGVACYKLGQMKTENVNYTARVYNIILLCSEPYTIDPTAVKFLVEHGFNFNNQYAQGLPYTRGNDKPAKSPPNKHSIRELFSYLIRQRKPMVLHNGLADLIFLYQGFYAQCPSNLSVFIADLSELFPVGIYDTKYIAEFRCRSPASFLTFVFTESYHKNCRRSKQEKMHLRMQFKSIPGFSTEVKLEKFEMNHSNETFVEPCEKYSAYGWCRYGLKCNKSHQISDIIRFHENKKASRKRKSNSNSLMLQHNSEDIILVEKIDTTCSDKIELLKSENLNLSKKGSQGHRSGMDAFMTGYAFCVFIALNYKGSHQKLEPTEGYSTGIPCLEKDTQNLVMNKLYMSGKNIPLQICKSEFTKTSKFHNEKFLKIYLE